MPGKRKKDILRDGENGWHEWIVVDNDRREYHEIVKVSSTALKSSQPGIIVSVLSL